MAIRHEGEYCFGDHPNDVWEYFVWWTRDSVEPVKHWRQAICKCGHTVFEVDRDEEAAHYLRRCVRCQAEHQIMGDEFADVPADAIKLVEEPEPDPDPVICICAQDEFEIVGATAPFLEAPNSAKWFYLGLRCVACGCLGCYADWCPRYNDHEAFLAMI